MVYSIMSGKQKIDTKPKGTVYVICSNCKASISKDFYKMEDNRVAIVIKCPYCRKETLYSKDFTWDFTFSEEKIPPKDLQILEQAFSQGKVAVGGIWSVGDRKYRCCGVGWKPLDCI